MTEPTNEHEWTVRSDTGKERTAETKQEAQRILEEVEHLGMDAEIIPPDIYTETLPTDSNENSELAGPTTPRPEPPSSGGLIQPVDVDEVVELYDQFEQLKDRLLDDNDVVEIDRRPHVTKSGWRKIATAFNVSVEILDTDREIDDGVIRYTARAEAVAPNGKRATSMAVATSTESNFTERLDGPDDETRDEDDVLFVDGAWRRLRDPRAVSEHNVATLAETRAKNRAISDLVGGGEVSAEEMKGF